MRRSRFYGQHGEDVVAWHALGDSEGPRFFVEVGMIDGRRFSNTLAFEEIGWSGVCVEPHPDYIDLVRLNRKGSLVVHAAASNRSALSAPFHAEARGALSGLAPRDERTLLERYGEYFGGFRIVDVPVKTLDEILVEASAPTEMELVSIDVEGTEFDVLEGLDLARWRPRVVIVEANDAVSGEKLVTHMHRAGYELARLIGGANLFFTRTPCDRATIRDARIDRPFVHTRHPRDAAGPNTVVRPTDSPLQRLLARVKFQLCRRGARRRRSRSSSATSGRASTTASTSPSFGSTIASS